MKYRIKIETEKTGEVFYLPQIEVKRFFSTKWLYINYDGEVETYGTRQISREKAIELIKANAFGKKKVEYEYININEL